MDNQSFGIYFDSGKQKVRLPVNPSELTVQYEGDNTNYNLVSLGEVVIPRNPKLPIVSIDSFFPRNSYITGTVSDKWYKPEFYVEFFTKLLRQKSIFRFIINRYDGNEVMFDTNFKAVLSGFEITDKGGESGDIYFKLSVQEYRNTEPQSVEMIGEDTEKSVTYLAQTKQREISNDEIVVGDMVTVSGPVYETDDQSAVDYATSRRHVTNLKSVITRVLPPSLIPAYNRVYISGVGWVQKSDCVKGNIDNTQQRLQPEIER